MAGYVVIKLLTYEALRPFRDGPIRCEIRNIWYLCILESIEIAGTGLVGRVLIGAFIHVEIPLLGLRFLERCKVFLIHLKSFPR
jgi:hypothetical protein